MEWYSWAGRLGCQAAKSNAEAIRVRLRSSRLRRNRDSPANCSKKELKTRSIPEINEKETRVHLFCYC